MSAALDARGRAVAGIDAERGAVEGLEENGLELFSNSVRHWFADAFGAPTAVQAEAWQAIARGENALVIAPTGSGKTLAAFLWAIDALMGEKARVAEAGEKWVRGVRVLYVSPLISKCRIHPAPASRCFPSGMFSLRRIYTGTYPTRNFATLGPL